MFRYKYLYDLAIAKMRIHATSNQCACSFEIAYNIFFSRLVLSMYIAYVIFSSTKYSLDPVCCYYYMAYR